MRPHRLQDRPRGVEGDCLRAGPRFQRDRASSRKASPNRWRRQTVCIRSTSSKLLEVHAVLSHLITGVRRVKLAVEVSGDDYAPRCHWVLRGNDIREALEPVWSLVRERVLLNVPLKLLQRVNDIIPDLSVVCAVRCPKSDVVIRLFL